MSDAVSTQGSRLSDGKNLFSAILLTGAGAVLIFILSRSLLLDQDFAASIYENGVPRALAGLSLLAFPYIHQRLAGQRHPNLSHLPHGPVPMAAYVLPWYIILAYGVLISFAIAGAGVLLVWLVGQASGIFITRAIPVVTWIMLPITFYYLGSWVGTRSTHRPFLVSMGITLGYIIFELLVTLLLKIDSPLHSRLGFVIVLVLSLVCALLGTRRGKHWRFSRYMDFLLRPLNEQDKQAVVDNLYGEVKRQISDGQEIPTELSVPRGEYQAHPTQPVPDSDSPV